MSDDREARMRARAPAKEGPKRAPVPPLPPLGAVKAAPKAAPKVAQREASAPRSRAVKPAAKPEPRRKPPARDISGPRKVTPPAMMTMEDLSLPAKEKEESPYPAPKPAPDPNEAETAPVATPPPKASAQTRPSKAVAAALQGRVKARVPLGPGDNVPGTRYRINRWLGEGGMGVVYEAMHIDLERKVALKILRRDVCDDPGRANQFREEARTANRLGSENIVEVYDFAELPDGRLMYTMELLEGDPLSDAIEESVFEAPRTIAILRQVCKALEAAHAADIVHRDIKPANIVLETRRGRADTVKILDFGIATMVAGGARVDIDVAGTPSYLAPEIIAEEPYGKGVDIYALGCTAYEMLVGHPPFRAETVEDVLEMHLESEPTPPSKARGDNSIPPALEAVVLRCLAKNPKARYDDVQDLEAALCEAQIDANLHTTWDDLPLPDIDPERRDRILRAMPDPMKVVSPAHGRRWMWPTIAIAGLVAALGLGYALASPEASVEERNLVDSLAISAHTAAAKSYYVYPPPENPREPTAYSHVLELEGFDGKLASTAREKALELRREFAATLTRLGDRYWDREGGQPFAIDYYAAALIFEPANDHASDRAALTPGQLAALRVKADNQSFTAAELRAAEPLIALAEEDPEERKRKLIELSVDDETAVRSAGVDAQLEKLVREEVGEDVIRARRKSRRAKSTKQPQPSPRKIEAEPIAVVEPTKAEPEPEPTPTTEPTPAPAGPAGKSARKEARQIARKGTNALRGGKKGEARRLFEQALDRDGANAEALIGLSDLHFHASNYGKAVYFARKAVRASPKASRYRVKLGDAYYKVFRYNDALKQYEKAVALGNKNAPQRVERVHKKLGK